MVIQASYFDIYAKNPEGKYRKVNIASSLDLIKSYHKLTTKQINQINNKSSVLKMYNSFKSILSSDLNIDFHFTSNVIIGSKISRIICQAGRLT